MSNRPEITHQQIRVRASDQSFSRGQNYYNRDMIRNTVLRGDEIQALCQGSYPEPYRVWARFDGHKIAETSCTCEYDWGGDCKHIVAMLLTYLYDPEQFEERQTLQDALLSRSKEDLIDIIRLMITRYPDLQDILDRPTPGTVIDQQDVIINTQTFRRELRQSLGFSGGWMDPTAENKVYEIATAGEQFARHGDYASAIAIYCTILEECNDSEYPTDDEGDYVVAVNHTIELLRDALADFDLSQNDSLRQRVFDALVDTFIWDVDFGGIGYGDDASGIILKIAQPKDIQRMRERVEGARNRQALKPYSNWGVEAYEQFLAELDTIDSTSPEETLERLRAQGMQYLLASKLLDLKRYEEAEAVIREHLTNTYELQRGLHLLVSHAQVEKAIQLAEEALDKAYNDRLVYWLIGLYQRQGNREAEFSWQLKRMQSEPSINHYIELKAASTAVGNWENVRPQILEQLKQQQAYEVLTLAYLHDEAWDLAWETLDKATTPQHHGPYWPVYQLDFTVAEKSRHARPERAIPVYIKYARKEIGHRSRNHYAVAASLLATVQQLYDQLDEIESWEALIADIRAEFKQLPALQDELNKAGL